jgi:hypothetical protein
MPNTNSGPGKVDIGNFQGKPRNQNRLSSRVFPGKVPRRTPVPMHPSGPLGRLPILSFGMPHTYRARGGDLTCAPA